MKFIQHLISILSLILLCAVIGNSLVPAPANALVQSCNSPDPNLTFEIPTNPASYSVLCEDTNIGFFAWQTFVALNWPADGEGKPLEDKKIYENLDRNRVWESYKSPNQVFQFERTDIPPLKSSELDLQSTSNLTLVSSSSESSQMQDCDSRLQGGLTLLTPDCQPLVDRWGNYILNEVRINPVEVEQIVNYHWNTVKGLEPFTQNQHQPFQLICSQLDENGFYPYEDQVGEKNIPCWVENGNSREGAVEIKAAWMVLRDSDTPLPANLPPLPDPKEYYTTKRKVDVNTPEGEKTVEVPVALVGFHILRKTSRNGWIWATFEHKDNAPDTENVEDLPLETYYNLYNSDCKMDCTANTSNAKKPYLWRDTFPHAVTLKDGNIVTQTSSQITRLVSIQTQAASLNDKWKRKLEQLSSPWKNYQLIGVQWLEDPKVPDSSKIRPKGEPNLANTTLEPYVQTTNIGKSCISCHAKARLPLSVKKAADFSFLIKHAKP